jgi:general secretion pathway protein A
MYTKHFGFEELPFSATPDPRFVYNSPVYDDVLNMLRYGIEAKKGFIVVSGEAGTGKTTLLRRLMRGFSDRIAYAYIFNPRLKFTSLLRVILKDLGIPAGAADKESMLEQLNEYVLRQHTQERIVVCIFDEAQGLSDEVLEELRLLGNLETDSEKLIQIILVGQPEIELRLDRAKLAQLKQRIAHRLVLHPLAPDEVGAYIAARLEQAGYKGGELFKVNAVTLIASYSGGIPRIINSLCDNALMRACKAGIRTVTPEMIDEAAKELRVDGRIGSEPKASLDQIHDLDEPADAETQPVVASRDRYVDAIAVAGFHTPPASATGAQPVRAGFAPSKKQLGFASAALMTAVVLAWSLASSWTPQPQVAVSSHTNDSVIEVRNVVPDLALTPAPVNTRGQSAAIMPQAPVGAIPDSAVPAVEQPGNGQRPPVAARKITPPPAHKKFRVSVATLLRNKPTANADIIDTLRPGLQVEIAGKGGDFLRVRSLGDDPVRGYVHVEDAFFEPLR